MLIDRRGQVVRGEAFTPEERRELRRIVSRVRTLIIRVNDPELIALWTPMSQGYYDLVNNPHDEEVLKNLQEKIEKAGVKIDALVQELLSF